MKKHRQKFVAKNSTKQIFYLVHQYAKFALLEALNIMQCAYWISTSAQLASTNVQSIICTYKSKKN